MQKPTYSKASLCKMWFSTADGITYAKEKKLLAKYPDIQERFNAFDASFADIVGVKAYEKLKEAKEKGLSHIENQLHEMGAYAVFRGEEGYPEILEEILDAPECLYVYGTLPNEKAIAVVGSRRDTRYGRTMATKISHDLAAEGVAIISGLARGIDTAAHIGALKARGKTVAVLGGGFHNLYPKENEELARNIVRMGGAVVSEYPPDAISLPFHFPRRNRIISGLSDGVLLIEATLHSGTMGTINHALSQGKDIYALPGNVDSVGSQLPLQILKEGAILCTGAEDIFPQLGIEGPNQPQKPPNIRKDHPILNLLEREEKTFQELLSMLPLTPDQLSAQLTELELNGDIEKRPGRAYARITE